MIKQNQRNRNKETHIYKKKQKQIIQKTIDIIKITQKQNQEIFKKLTKRKKKEIKQDNVN